MCLKELRFLAWLKVWWHQSSSVTCILRCIEYFVINILYLRFMGSKTKQKRFFSPSPKKSPVDEARDLLATVILAHVPVSHLVFHCLEG